MEDDKSSPKLPIPGKRNILITSALPCVNKFSHPGNIIGCVLSAYAYARYCRLRGYNAIHISGTDDYGTATETNSFGEDKYHVIQKEVYDSFDIRFDMFGRTSTPEQTQVGNNIFKELWKNQCQRCARIFYNGDTDQSVKKLPDLKDKLEKYINKTSATGSWSHNAIQTTKPWLEKELDKIRFTRDLKWGVPISQERSEDKKVSYDWFDAPIGYISITSCYTSEWEKWWKNPENVELYQFMGPDNVPLHTVIFPSMQLGTGENWTLMKTISVTEYLNYEGEKFSRSEATNIHVDVWRYYLLTDRPEVSDTSSFEWTDLQAKRNNRSLRNLGDFVTRVLSFIANPELGGYGSVIPDAPGAESHLPTVALGNKVGKLMKEYIKAMENVKVKQALKTAMKICVGGNRYLEQSNFWQLFLESNPNCAVVIRTTAGLIHLLAKLLEPFMPSFSREVSKQLNLTPHFCERGEVLQASRPWEILPPGHRIGTPQSLFEELRGIRVQQWEQKFAQSSCDRRLDRKRVKKRAARSRRHANAQARLLELIGRDAREASTNKADYARREDAARANLEDERQQLELREAVCTADV